MNQKALKCFICGLDLKDELRTKILSYWKVTCPSNDWCVYICNQCRKESFITPCNSKDLLWQKILKSSRKKIH